METNPSMFFPHDEFETVKEYKEKSIRPSWTNERNCSNNNSKIRNQKSKKITGSKRKRIKRKAIVETLMSESSSSC